VRDALALAAKGSLLHEPLRGNSHAVFQQAWVVSMFGAVFGVAILAPAIGAARFWHATNAPEPGAAASATALGERRHALALSHLDGGHSAGCNEADDHVTLAWRRFHHVTFYAFMLCFASTCVATWFHYGLGPPAPYAVTSLPVLLGTAGGIGLLIGAAGLSWLNLRRDLPTGDAAQQGMDRGFIALLLLTSGTGLALLVWRDSGAMALWLTLHLGVVMALFLTLAYGKFAHGVYRCAALLKWAIEKRRPKRPALEGD
jgi:citrate/tricarballylate utilization protein